MTAAAACVGSWTTRVICGDDFCCVGEGSIVWPQSPCSIKPCSNHGRLTYSNTVVLLYAILSLAGCQNHLPYNSFCESGRSGHGLTVRPVSNSALRLRDLWLRPWPNQKPRICTETLARSKLRNAPRIRRRHSRVL